MTLSADSVASVIITRSGSWLTAMKLQKLLYYVQAWHVAVTDEPLFTERFKAWPDGPVVPQVWHARKGQETRRASTQDIENVKLDDLASDLIDLVLARYGSMSGDELSALTHIEGPWVEARNGLPEGAESSEPISVESMASFYRAHRQLGGRTAADLAACGVHVRSGEIRGPVDVDAILASLDGTVSSTDDDPWGGANLTAPEELDMNGIETRRRRAKSGR